MTTALDLMAPVSTGEAEGITDGVGWLW
jgi:hypothetical protein